MAKSMVRPEPLPTVATYVLGREQREQERCYREKGEREGKAIKRGPNMSEIPHKGYASQGRKMDSLGKDLRVISRKRCKSDAAAVDLLREPARTIVDRRASDQAHNLASTKDGSNRLARRGSSLKPPSPACSGLGRSITNSRERLAAIGDSLAEVHRDLDKHARDIRRALDEVEAAAAAATEEPRRRSSPPALNDKDAANGNTLKASSSLTCLNKTEQEVDNAPTVSSSSSACSIPLATACSYARRDLRLARLARLQFESVLTDVRTAMAAEERDVALRADCLCRESEIVFGKAIIPGTV